MKPIIDNLALETLFFFFFGILALPLLFVAALLVVPILLISFTLTSLLSLIKVKLFSPKQN